MPLPRAICATSAAMPPKPISLLLPVDELHAVVTQPAARTHSTVHWARPLAADHISAIAHSVTAVAVALDQMNSIPSSANSSGFM